MAGTGQTMIRYPIDLPTDYDMDIIRERVRTRGHALDDRAGLWFKAYCIREIGVHESAHNQYAPFYVWHDAAAAATFLWGGGGFDGIIRDFARPSVETWLPVAVAEGEAPHPAVTTAELRTVTLSRDYDLTAQAERLRQRAEAAAREPGVHLAGVGINPTSWRAVEFITRASKQTTAEAAETTIYTVLHVSQPA
jgi:hypothetical protein